MGKKSKETSQHTPFQGELICSECRKLGNAYQCSFCENYKTCGECGVCNKTGCNANTKVKKAPEVKTTAATPAPKTPVNVPGLSTKPEVKPKAPKTAPKEDAYLEKKIESAQKKEEKKAEEKKAKIKIVAEPNKPAEAKKKAAKETVESVGPNSPRVGEEKRTATLKEVLAEVDVSEVAKTEGDLEALKALLEAHFQTAALPPAKIGVSVTTTSLNEPFSDADAGLKKALYYSVKPATATAAKAMFVRLVEEIVRDAKKPEAQRGQGQARLLLAQAVARAHPTVVVEGAVVAAKDFAKYESQQTAIPVMWLLAQGREMDMASTVDAWAQYVVGALLAKESGDALVRLYATKLTDLLAASKVPAREAKEGVKLDLISLYQKAYGTTHDDYSSALMKSLNFVKTVWMTYALKEQVEEVFGKIVAFFETKPRTEQQDYANALTELAGQLLSKDGWLFDSWRADTQTKLTGGNAKAVAYLKGSQHLLAALRARGYVASLHRAELQKTVVALASAGEQMIVKIGKPSEKKGDLASKAIHATEFFHDFNRSVTPSKWPSRLRWIFVLALISALVLKTNDHCKAFPCGATRQCGDMHPCHVVRHAAAAPYLDMWGSKAEELRLSALTHAKPIMPYVVQAQELVHEHVVKPATPHVAKAYDATKYFVDAEIVPVAHKVWENAKPHVDTATAWAEENVRPHAEVAYGKATEYSQQGWVWAEANVVKPGSVYAAQGAEWAKVNVGPHVQKGWKVAVQSANQAADHVATHVYPQVADGANRAWVQAQDAAAKARVWAETEAAQLGPKAARLYDDASIAAVKYYGQARVHVQTAVNEAQPWVEKNIVPHALAAWEAACRHAEAASEWVQMQVAALQGKKDEL